MGFITGTGRIGRLRYLGIAMANGMVMIVIMLATMSTNPVTGEAQPSPIIIPFAVVAIWISYTNMIRRLHDVGKSGWLCLLVFVPIVGIGLHLYLLFAGGDAVGNRFGPPYGQKPLTPEAHRQRADQITAAAAAAYSAGGDGNLLNEDGSYNMDGLTIGH